MQISRLLMTASAAILVSAAGLGQSASDTVFQIHPVTNLVNNGGPIIDSVINVTNSGASIGMNFAVNSGPGPFGNGGGFVNFGTVPSQNNYSIVGYGNICVNLYAFSFDEQLQSCCSCQLSPNAIGSWDVLSDILSNTLTGAKPKDLVIKLVSTLFNGSLAQVVPGTGVTTFVNIPTGVCNPGTAGQPVSILNTGFPSTTSTSTNLIPNSVLAPGMIAYARTQIPIGASIFYTGGTESAFVPATLSMGTGTVYAGEPSPKKELDNITALCAFNQVNGSGTGVCKACALEGK